MINNRLRLGFAVLLVAILSLSAPLGAAAAGIGGRPISSAVPAIVITRAPSIVSRISMLPRSPNTLLINQKINLTFFYNTNWGMGVVVTAVPMTGTAISAGAAICKTAVLPVGHGTATCTISVGTGGLVNGIRFQMWDSTQKSVLFQTVVPVRYQIGGPANMVNTLVFSPAAPNVQMIGKGVSVKFNYRTSQAGGVRVFAIPFTGATATANYATCASAIYAVGVGSGTCRFTITSGNVVVTSVHVQMWDAAQAHMLAEQVYPVVYRFITRPTMTTYVALSPATPNIIRLGDKATIHFNYQTNQAAGIVVDMVPFTGGVQTANSTSTASAVLPVGIGKGSASFAISTGTNVTVTAVKVQVWDATHTTLLFAMFLPVQYQFQ